MIFYAFISGCAFTSFLHALLKGNKAEIFITGGMTIIWLLDAYFEKKKTDGLAEIFDDEELEK